MDFVLSLLIVSMANKICHSSRTPDVTSSSWTRVRPILCSHFVNGQQGLSLYCSIMLEQVTILTIFRLRKLKILYNDTISRTSSRQCDHFRRLW